MKPQKQNYHSKYNSFYCSREWQQLRQTKWVAENGLCEICKKQGIIKEAREIHHIEPITENWNKRLDYDNLIALCSDCHNAIHNRQSPLQKFLSEWDKIN